MFFSVFYHPSNSARPYNARTPGARRSALSHKTADNVFDRRARAGQWALIFFLGITLRTRVGGDIKGKNCRVGHNLKK